MGLLRVLDELDRMQRLLEEEFPECKIGYAYRPGHVTWSAQIGPVLNADSPDALRAAIRRACAEVLAKINGRAQTTARAHEEPRWASVPFASRHADVSGAGP
jgi:hypothetical protein